ncbi:hypothetical protein EYF80_042357 [Liparis tanakae]|uniref:Uncharacterized protein n=1 Tax=Liparis tanakae TaxID=230148 RepID=A0A4Z2G4H6_9TELE|nr:hypothetical protein EYF80_042357 [Liparis tanakae]
MKLLHGGPVAYFLFLFCLPDMRVSTELTQRFNLGDGTPLGGQDPLVDLCTLPVLAGRIVYVAVRGD